MTNYSADRDAAAALDTQYTLDENKFEYQRQFQIGADWAIRESAVVENLVEAIKEVIRNSHDIIAKKVCSKALSAYGKAIKEIKG